MLAWIEEARAAGPIVLTGGGLDGRAPAPDRGREPAGGREALVRRGVRPRRARCSRTTRSTRRSTRANATRYGLQAGIFTASLQRALEAARRLEFGGVTVNEAPTFRADQMPYGGVKDSGNTREGPAWAVREMTEERLVVVQL